MLLSHQSDTQVHLYFIFFQFLAIFFLPFNFILHYIDHIHCYNGKFRKVNARCVQRFVSAPSILFLLFPAVLKHLWLFYRLFILKSRFFFKNNFIEVEFTYHKIDPFSLYNSAIFMSCTANHHNPIWEHFHHPTKVLLGHLWLFHSHLQPQAAWIYLFSVSIDLLIPDISFK